MLPTFQRGLEPVWDVKGILKELSNSADISGSRSERKITCTYKGAHKWEWTRHCGEEKWKIIPSSKIKTASTRVKERHRTYVTHLSVMSTEPQRAWHSLRALSVCSLVADKPPTQNRGETHRLPWKLPDSSLWLKWTWRHAIATLPGCVFERRFAVRELESTVAKGVGSEKTWEMQRLHFMLLL